MQAHARGRFQKVCVIKRKSIRLIHTIVWLYFKEDDVNREPFGEVHKADVVAHLTGRVAFRIARPICVFQMAVRQLERYDMLRKRQPHLIQQRLM